MGTPANYSAVNSAMAWLVLVVLFLCLGIGVAGNPGAGIALVLFVTIIILIMFTPPATTRFEDAMSGTGKYIYTPNGAVRYDPNTVRSADATVPFVSPA